MVGSGSPWPKEARRAHHVSKKGATSPVGASLPYDHYAPRASPVPLSGDLPPWVSKLRDLLVLMRWRMLTFDRRRPSFPRELREMERERSQKTEIVRERERDYEREREGSSQDGDEREIRERRREIWREREKTRQRE